METRRLDRFLDGLHTRPSCMKDHERLLKVIQKISQTHSKTVSVFTMPLHVIA